MSEYKPKTAWLKKRLADKQRKSVDPKTYVNADFQTSIIRSRGKYKAKEKLIEDVSKDIAGYRKFEYNKSRGTQSSSTRRVVK